MSARAAALQSVAADLPACPQLDRLRDQLRSTNTDAERERLRRQIDELCD